LPNPTCFLKVPDRPMRMRTLPERWHRR